MLKIVQFAYVTLASADRVFRLTAFFIQLKNSVHHGVGLSLFFAMHAAIYIVHGSNSYTCTCIKHAI